MINGIISSYSDNAACVEVEYDHEWDAAEQTHVIVVRNSKTGELGGQVRFTVPEWEAFLKGVKAGEFETDTLKNFGQMTATP